MTLQRVKNKRDAAERAKRRTRIIWTNAEHASRLKQLQEMASRTPEQRWPINVSWVV